jgi:YbbR domain-containing protein
MTLIRFIFRNWALKGGAMLLAIILFVAMVAFQSTQSWPGEVSIEPVNQPLNAFLIKPHPMPTVGSIRYIASGDVRVSSASFRATIDLKDVNVSSSDNTLVKVHLVAEDQRIQIIDYQPQQISVTLDPVQTKSVAVRVNPGVIPSGLSMGPMTLSVSQVEAIGAATALARVSTAEARGVRIDASGLDVSEDAPLVPVDASGAVVDNVTLNPPTVHVQIQVGSQLRTETVPVNPDVVGTPAAGYYITSIDVTPPVVSVSGEADALAQLKGMVNTQPISIAGATGDVSVRIALRPPSGVEAPDATTIAVVVHLQSPSSTRTVTIGLVPNGARSDRVYTLSTPNVTVTLGGATFALNAFDTSTLVGIVSVGGLDPGTHTVKIVLILPSVIKLVAISPAQVYVTVTIPPSPPPSASPAPTV